MNEPHLNIAGGQVWIVGRFDASGLREFGAALPALLRLLGERAEADARAVLSKGGRIVMARGREGASDA